MTDFLQRLPAPVSSSGFGDAVGIGSFPAKVEEEPEERILLKKEGPPPYMHRQGFIPVREADFGDGGAFPEVLVAQFPLDMGKTQGGGGTTLTLQLGADGKLAFDVAVKDRSNKAVVYTRPESAHGRVPVAASERRKPDAQAQQDELKKTQQAISKLLAERQAAAVPQAQKKEAQFIRYTPAKQLDEHNSGCAQRLLRLDDMAVDPLEPPRFKHRRVPAARFSPPPPVLHSPTRKLTLQDQQDWKIPPCVSNWRNQKGYTIPLDKRVAADGRNLQDISVNEKFASLSEALYIAERQAREEIRLRNEVKKLKKVREEELREQQLRQLAAQARAERAQLLQQQRQRGGEEDAERQKREQLARERERDVERAVRLEKHKGRRREDSERDISELIALGLPADQKRQRLDTQFDARLFQQGTGTDSGFKGGEDEAYQLYSKPLFAQRSGAGIYQFSRDRFVQSVGEGSELAAFAGADKSSFTRTAPVEFEKDVSDPFGLDTLLSEARKK